MGWSFCPSHNKSACIRSILEDFKSIGTVLKHTCVGSHLWCVVQTKNETFISLDLLANGGRGHGWGNKGMSEAMHPYFYSCPLSYLELAPVACEKWREGVYAYHARRNLKVEVGKTYTVTSGNWKVRGNPIKTVVVETLKPLTGVVDGYANARLPRRLLADLTLAVAV